MVIFDYVKVCSITNFSITWVAITFYEMVLIVCGVIMRLSLTTNVNRCIWKHIFSKDKSNAKNALAS